MSTAVEFIHVSKRFEDAASDAVEDVSFSIEEGELVTILGTSGCGKTTLLRMVNSLIRPSAGSIKVFDKDISSTDPVELRRQIGYVIQQIGLFPHMTVRHNIATVPKILGWSKDKIDARVDELLEMVNLDPDEFRDRYPSQLSGGQQQRIGLARALAADPKLMLLDEPFGAIDAINRTVLQDELINIHQKSRKTFLFVTHDILEALKLGTRVMVMDKGSIRQFDTPGEILKNPADDYVKQLMDSFRQGFAFALERGMGPGEQR